MACYGLAPVPYILLFLALMLLTMVAACVA
jgi:hypothetical protein